MGSSLSLSLWSKMALSAKLVMRQSQSMVMTPQLLQAIKLLQLPNVELAAYIESELERNPLLERADEDEPAEGAVAEAPARSGEGEGEQRDWASQELEVDAGALARDLGTEIDNAFDGDRSTPPPEKTRPEESQGLSATSWSGIGAGGGDGEAPNLESYVAAQ